MRAAPAVQLALGPDRAWRVAVALLGAAAGASLAGWALAWSGVPPAVLSGAACLLAAAAGAWLTCRLSPAPRGRLAWDGAQWQWCGVEGELEVVADLGPWMLLRFLPWRRGQAVWLPVGRAAAAAAWHPLRAAVYCRRPRIRAPAVVRTTAPNEPE